MQKKWSPLEGMLALCKTFAPAQISTDYHERLRACAGMLAGLLLTGLATRTMLSADAAIPMLLAPIGASAVLLFGVPASPLAQPWSIVGGNMLSAMVGVLCVHMLGPSLACAALATALAVAAMFLLRCLHPPGGAVALTAVLGGPLILELGYRFVLIPVGINSVLLALFALAYNNVTGRRYPHAAQPDHSGKHGTGDARPMDRLGFQTRDLDEVLQKYNQVLDVSRDDLESLFLQTEMHAYRRRFGEITCADIMSKDVITTEYGASLEEAWNLLREHKIKALPVIDKARRVVGIVTLVDFMKNANLEVYENFEEKLRQLLRRTRLMHSSKPEVVGQIMSHPVRTVRHDMHIVELVPLLSDHGLHHIPIINEERRLIGMLTQSDLVAALYRGKLADTER